MAMSVSGAFQARATFASVPKYQDLRGPGGTNDVIMGDYPDATDPTNGPEAKVYAFCQRQMDNMKTYRDNYDNMWDYYYGLFLGRQWAAPGGGSISRGRPHYARLNINYLYPIIDTIVSALFDNDPKPSLIATSSEQTEYVEQMQAAMDQVWFDEEVLDKAEQAYVNACIYGTGYLKAVYNPEAKDRQGAIEVLLIPPENLYVSTDMVDIKPGKTNMIMEVSVKYVSELRRRFKSKASRIRPDPSAMAYAERKVEGGVLRMDSGTARERLFSRGGVFVYRDRVQFERIPLSSCSGYPGLPGRSGRTLGAGPLHGRGGGAD